MYQICFTLGSAAVADLELFDEAVAEGVSEAIPKRKKVATATETRTRKVLPFVRKLGWEEFINFVMTQVNSAKVEVGQTEGKQKWNLDQMLNFSGEIFI